MIEAAELELQWLLQQEAEAPEWMKSYIRATWKRLKLQLVREKMHHALQSKILDDELFVTQSDFNDFVNFVVEAES